MKILLVFVACWLGNVRGQGEEGWLRKDYPNPLTEVERCKRAGVLESYICDPDEILSVNEASQLERSLRLVRNETICPCSQHFCDGKSNAGYKIGIALVKKIKPDGSARTEENAADVGYVIDQSLHESRLFAYTMLQQWGMGQCGEDVVIVYALDDNVFYTMTGKVAGEKLTASKIGSISMNTRSMFAPSTVSKGLKNLVEQYKAVFLGQYVGPEYDLRVEALPLVSGNGASFSLPSLLLLLISLVSTRYLF